MVYATVSSTTANREVAASAAHAPFAIVLVISLFPGTVCALQAEWSVGAEAQYSDNIRLAPEDEESEWTRIGRLGIGLLHNAPDMDAQVGADYTYRDYAGDTYEDEGTLESEALIDWRIVPDYFSWQARGRYARVPIATTGADTPDNFQDAYGFVTGPDLVLPFTSVDFLRLGARYGRYGVEETVEDSERYAASLGLVRRLSSLTELSLNSRYTQVRYDEQTAVQTDYDRVDTYLALERRLRLGSLSAAAGYTSIQRDNLEDVEGALARLSWRRDLASQSEAGLELSYQVTDIAGAFTDPADDPLAVDPETITVTGDLADETRVAGFYNASSGRTSIGLESRWVREDYQEADDLDRQRMGASLGLAYLMTPHRRLSLDVMGDYIDYETLDRQDEELTASLALIQQLGRHVTASLSYQRGEVRSNVEDVAYEENLYILSLTYTGATAPDGSGGR